MVEVFTEVFHSINEGIQDIVISLLQIGEAISDEVGRGSGIQTGKRV
jgi:hypothetical protein